MYNIRLGYGCGIKATLLTSTGAVFDLRKARYKGAVLMLPNGASIPCADVSIDDVTNSVYVRLLADRELTMIGKYGIMFNLKLANGVMYSSPMVVFAEVSADAEVEYKELNISLGVALTYLPANVAYTGASPKIGPNGTWLVYNDELNAYEDTGEPANYGGLLGEVQSLKDIIETSLTPHFITSAVKVDWETIGKNADGELCYIGAGIGDNEGNIDIAILEGYLTDKGYAKHIDIAKEYATKEWVEKKKFITIDSLPQKISVFVNDKGYITIDALASYATLATTLGGYGITNAYTKTETDARIFGEVKRLFEDPRFVTAAVNIDGRTIKRDGNGALYVDETALSVSGGGGVADSVYWNNVIGKPSWIGSIKPSYKYSEIEEKPDLSVYAKLTDIPSLNGYATQSWVENKGYLLATTASDTYQPKITSSNKLAYSLISGTPDLSVYALKTAIPTKLSQLTDDVVAGKYLSITGGTINGNITANNIVASSVLGVNAVNGKYSFMVVPSGDNTYIEAAKTDGTSNKGNIIFSGLNAENLNSLKILSDSVTSNGNITAPKFIGNLTGNADSATKLAKKVSLWGQEFDGTKDITGAMTVDGDATFSSKVVIGGISLRKVDNYLFIDSPLVLSGGVTMYGDDGTTVKPIWESIPFDRTTIDWVNGQWTVVGGTGGGGISEEFLNVTLQGYQPKITSSNKLAYSLISGTPTIPTKLSQLTDDVVSGKYLSITGGTIYGNITANNIVASSVLGVNAVNGKYSFMVVPSGDNTYIEAAKTDGTSNKGNIIFSGLNAENLNSLKILSDSVTSNGNITAPKFIGNLTGNADSATKLATARTIWGQSFDGTGNITGNIAFGAAEKISWHNSPSHYYISSPTDDKGALLEYKAFSGHRFLGGNVAIGGTTADAKLHVHGTAKFEGDTTFSSKVVIGTIPVYQSADGTLFIDANVVFRGGVAMYGNTTTTVNEE